MGNSIDDFCKCQNNDIVTQMKLDRSEKIEKDLTTRTNSNSYSKIKSKNNNIQNKDLIKCNSINSTLNFESNIFINQIKQNSASRKITKFFRLVKVKKDSLQKLLLSNEYFIDFNKNNTFKKENNKIKNTNNKSERQIKIISDYIKEYSPSTYLGPKTKEGKKTGLGFQVFYTNNKDNNNLNSNLLKSAILICKFKNNIPLGIGKIFFINQYHCFYYGEINNYSCEGYGIYYNNEKCFYEGFWKKDSPFKIGIEKWEDDSYFEGEYFKGKKNGIGIYYWKDGSYYEGQWKDNLINGFGIYHYPNKEKIQKDNFSNEINNKIDIKNKNNKFKNKNSNVNNNKIISDDILIENHKKYFIGCFKNNLREGLGEEIGNDKKYFGYFKNDKKNGFGIMYWINSNKAYIGFWKDGKQIGIGKCLIDNKVKYGFFNDNEKVFWIKEQNLITYLKYWNLQDIYSKYDYFFKLKLSDIQYFFEEEDFSFVL